MLDAHNNDVAAAPMTKASNVATAVKIKDDFRWYIRSGTGLNRSEINWGLT